MKVSPNSSTRSPLRPVLPTPFDTRSLTYDRPLMSHGDLHTAMSPPLMTSRYMQSISSASMA